MKTIWFKLLLISALVPAYGWAAGPSKPSKGQSKDLSQDSSAQDQVKELKGELLIMSTEARANQQLKKLLGKYKGTSMEPGLWFRMAELQLRRAKSARFFEMNRETNSVVTFGPAVVKNVSSRKYIQEAINTYEMIQSKFPRFVDMDMVFFNNAFARQQIAQNDKAKALYRRLISTFPDSSLIPDAHLALGEMLYDEKSFSAALAEYDSIKKYPESRVYPYGLYKAAWAHYNLQQTAKGIKELEAVVAYSKDLGNKSDTKLDLRKEALGDMVLFFSELYPANAAFSYFYKQAGAHDTGPYMLKLGKLYSHHGRHKDLEVVLKEYIDELPESREVPRAHDDLITAYESQKDRKGAIFELTRLSKVCDPKSKWTKKQQSGEGGGDVESMTTDDPISDCKKIFNATASKLAANWHKAWLKEKKDQNLGDAAEKAYELYLAGPAEAEKKAKARFSYAEILFQRNKFRESSAQYAMVSTAINDVKMRHDASYGALVSLESAVKGTWSDDDEKLFKDLVKSYINLNPKGPYISELQFKQAFIAYEKGKYDEAGPQFKALALENPKAPKAIKAQDLYLDILNVKKDFDELKTFSKQWAGISQDPARREKLNKIYQEAYFAQVQKLEENKKSAQAISEYKKFATENASSNLADKAWWNAAQLEYKTGNLMAGADTSYHFFKLFPKNAKAKEALVRAAQTYELTGQLKPAADVLEDLAKIDSAESQKWLLVAANFRLLTGSVDKARGLFRQLAETGKKDISHSAIIQLEALEKKHGTKEAHRKILGMALSKNVEPLASSTRLANLQDLFDKKEYKLTFKNASDLVSDKEASRKARAGARFLQARILEDEFRAQSVKTNVERVAIVLGIKTEKLEKAQRAYQEVAKMGDPEYAVKALRQLASAYDHYVKAVRGMELLKTLKPEEEEVLGAELEKLTAPIEEKAVDTLSEALKQAKKFEIRDGSIAQIQIEINRMNMKPTDHAHFQIEAPGMALPRLGGSPL